VSPTRLPNSQPSLTGESCPSANECMTVGVKDVGMQIFSDFWNGATWKLQLIRTTTSDSHQSLSGLSCTSKTSCYAVGSRDASPVVYEYSK
jgi:hypothetical protein